jgi:hypothetical protein
LSPPEIANTIRFIASINTPDNATTVRFVANRHTTWACKHLHHNQFPFNQRSLV